MIEKSKWPLLQNMIYQKTSKNIFANKNIEHVIESDSCWLFFRFSKRFVTQQEQTEWQRGGLFIFDES